MEQNVHYAVAAVKNNTFAEIEEKLYKQYPQYRETNNDFMGNNINNNQNNNQNNKEINNLKNKL